jgi:hypothetical protein
LLSSTSSARIFARQAQISQQLQQIRTFITTMSKLTADQLADVDERLEHIEEASKRLGRKDWLMGFYGAVLSLVFSDLITPSVAQRILDLPGAAGGEPEDRRARLLLRREGRRLPGRRAARQAGEPVQLTRLAELARAGGDGGSSPLGRHSY